MGHKVIDNQLWESYTENEMKVKDNVDADISDHKKNVAKVFNILGMVNTTSIIDDLHQ